MQRLYVINGKVKCKSEGKLYCQCMHNASDMLAFGQIDSLAFCHHKTVVKVVFWSSQALRWGLVYVCISIYIFKKAGRASELTIHNM